MTESFPRQQARTRRFTLGVPRAFQVSPDGQRITFLRSKAGDDPVTCLWELDVASGEERLVADPRALGADEENLAPQERARRERVRETAAGIVAFSTDHDAHHRRLRALRAGLHRPARRPRRGAPRLDRRTETPALDPRVNPSGTLVAYVHEGALRVTSLADGEDRVVAREGGVTFGLAEFVAAEEMGRARGYWWSPDSSGLLIERVDESPVRRWHIADPANPGSKPAEVAYPAAGRRTPTCRCSSPPAPIPTGPRSPQDEAVIDTTPLAVAPAAGVRLTEVGWDRARFPYLVTVAWDKDLLIVVQSRDQKTMRLFNGRTGETLREDTDPHWTDIIGGVPAQLGDGSIVWTEISEDTRRLIVAQPGELAGAAAGHPGRAPGQADPRHRRRRRALHRLDRPHRGRACGGTGPAGLREVATAPGVHTATARRRDDRARQQDPGQRQARGLGHRGRRRAGGLSRGDRLARRGAQPAARRPRASSTPGPPASAPPCSSRPGMSRARGCRC